MAVYIDKAKHAFGRMRMCHMVADTTHELNAMADGIGVARKWIQKAGSHYEHYDICMSKRVLAISLGAVEITTMELGRFLRARRKQPK